MPFPNWTAKCISCIVKHDIMDFHNNTVTYIHVRAIHLKKTFKPREQSNFHHNLQVNDNFVEVYIHAEHLFNHQVFDKIEV